MTDGIICIDKPEGFTSFDVVAKTRGITKCRKIGHGGTLDPMATGVLPLFFGRAAKAMSLMPVQEKRYTASFQLGIVTDSQDLSGTVLERLPAHVTREQLEQALIPMRGEQKQLPPMFSAVWVDGQRLYNLARQGREVERPLRDVVIHSLELLDFDEERQTGVVDIRCSKGTYVRTICHDIGQTLGCGAALSALRRTETLGYGIQCCHTLDQLQQLADEGRLDEVTLPVESAFTAYPRIYLSPKQAGMFLNGVRLDTKRIRCPAQEDMVRVMADGKFLGLARIDRQAEELIIVKLFVLEQE
ncbi:tRNA pseudouridine(55) synthase TruB [Angelakisella massiliensis]|uniref:tRNA pseudouridine(55) synthase TruB n=1 Tax=Angelakisella massiliensis TaxID=1871018 RepID=UPI0008F839EE|nr:tRNA pseudouridine(55) synthase TruB [Angelakisella massiliensis]